MYKESIEIHAGLCLLSTLAIPASHSHLVSPVAIAGKFFITVTFGVVYLYTSEVFPTCVRATGVATASFFARVGGIAAGWLALLDAADPALPTLAYAGAALCAGGLALFLPETKGEKMPDTLEESEAVPMTPVKKLFSLKR